MRRLACIAAAMAALCLSACGDDEDEATTGATGTTGSQGASSGDFMSADEFIDAPIPDQVEEVKTIAGITPECEGVKTDPGGDFQVAVAINAAQAPPDTPLEEIVTDQCAER